LLDNYREETGQQTLLGSGQRAKKLAGKLCLLRGPSRYLRKQQ
jgi:hypothetical protein